MGQTVSKSLYSALLDCSSPLYYCGREWRVEGGREGEGRCKERVKIKEGRGKNK